MVGDPYQVPRRAFCGTGRIAVIRSAPYLSVCRNRTAGDRFIVSTSACRYRVPRSRGSRADVIDAIPRGCDSVFSRP